MFQSVVFAGTHLEISYVEERDVESVVQTFRTLVIPADVIQDEIVEVVDALQQLVDHALIVQRNPPERVRHSR
jgi:hypothetical protein